MRDITKMPIIGTLTTKEVEYTVTSHLKDSNNVSKHTLPKETYSIVEIQEHNGHTYYITNQWYKEYKGEPQIIVDELVEEYTPANGMYNNGGGVGNKEYLVFVMEASSDAFQKTLEVVKEKNLDSAIKIAKDKTTKGVFTEVYESNGKKEVGVDEFIGYTNPNDKENFYYSDGYAKKQAEIQRVVREKQAEIQRVAREKYEDENTWIIKYISTDDDDVASVWVIAENREDAIDQAEEDNSDIGEIISVEKVAANGMMMANGGTIKESIDLFFQEGGSDKEYHIQLVDLQDGTYVVNFQFGRRGSALKHGTKTETPVALAQAEKIYASLKREKMGKGYAPNSSMGSNSPAPAQQVQPASKQVYILPQLLNPVEDAEMYINDDSFLAQEKKDYERRIIISDGKGNVMGLNKKGQQVPVPKNIANSIKNECTLDGEISDDVYYVFDIISFEGKDLKSYSATQRLEYLSAMEFGNSVEVVETAYTTAQKRDMFETLKAERREGIVFKKKSASYTPGRPNSGGNQLKYKFYKTATFIVANETKDKRSVGLELIDDNTGQRIFMGKVTIPPNYDVPAIGDLVEVRYLYAYRGGAVYQPTYLGKRNDSDLTDATMKQIIYKADEE